ncbi:MAG: CBS domain-containing protein [Deltaproteobacteria bacterium]|nr:CBS domain-containing protein [Deltaproteobacteria bacterium]MBI2229080.1 CBS domain-containing protein [Deltaproteobacteria bacterium]MBI2364473.1 CBS domain-containing protein [Deltaproteobacteria bacterium]MBI3067125.1 CBS domain-containing protein [Deltaproteobacteria bacterium]
MKKVRDILEHKGRNVWSIEPDASVFDALKLMAEKDIGALIVLDGGNLVGIISERDYARKIVLLGRASPTTQVKEIMTTDVVCVDPERNVDECMALVTERRVRHLPVLENGKLIGLISIGDLVKSIITEQQFIIEQLERYITG